MTPTCPRCEKPLPHLCMCAALPATPLPTSLKILILQHPQEPDHELGTARIAALALESARLRVGLSCANLAKAWEMAKSSHEDAEALSAKASDPKRWGVLYLQGSIPSGLRPGLYRQGKKPKDGSAPKLDPVEGGLDGLVFLDGTWSQAKAIWWRNPWLLKLQKLALVPSRPSAYGRLRKEPRPECVSTLEAIAESLAFLEPKNINAPTQLRSLFDQLLVKFRSRRD